MGNHYELTSGVVTKYYYAGSQRIAMRTNGTLNYLLGDHLGSTSLTTSATGTVISEMRYKAWGEVRYASGTTPTKYQYTGQYSYVSDFGLHFYNARWYDSSLGRFAQADTVIPEGVQGYDHYAYTSNNPLRYTDPTGHRNCEEDGYNCDGLSTYTLAAINFHKEHLIDNRWWHNFRREDEYDAIGDGQITDIEMQTPYGNILLNKDETPRKVGLGLRPSSCDSTCIKNMDQDDPDVAFIAMRTKLNTRLAMCNNYNCTATDKFIIAALTADDRIFPQDAVFKNAFGTYKSTNPNSTTHVDWQVFLRDTTWFGNTKQQDISIDVIHNVEAEALTLQDQGYDVPNVDWGYVTGLH